MADEPVIGGVSVEVTANLTKYNADMDAAKAKAQALDQAASQAMGNVAKSTDGLTETQSRLVQQLQAAGVSTEQLAKQYPALAAAMNQAAQATSAQASALQVDTAAANANSSAIMSLGKATAASAAATVADATARRNVAAVLGLEKVASEATTKAHISGRVAVEGLAAVHEILQGRMSRLPGTLLIEAQAMAGTTRTAAFLSAVMSPLGLTIIGVTGATIAGIAAFTLYEKAQKDLAASALGLGAASGISGSQVKDSAGDNIGNLKSSYDENVKAIEAFDAAGMRSRATIEDLSTTVADFARLTGEKTPAAVKILADAMKDPAKGAEELNAKLSFLDGTELQHIQTLERLGETQQAQAELTEELKKRTDDASEAAGGFQTSLGKLVKAGEALIHIAPQVVSAMMALDGGNRSAQSKTDNARERLQAEVQRRAQLDKDSAAGLPLVKATPEVKAQNERETLQGDATVLKRKMAADSALAALDKDSKARAAHMAAVQQDRATLDEYSRALQSFLTPAEKVHQLAVLSAQEAKARQEHNKQAVGDLAAQRARVEASGEVMSQGQVNQRMADARLGAVDRTRTPKNSFADDLASVNADTSGELALARAYGESSAAALQAEAARKALTAATKAGRTEAQQHALVQAEIGRAMAADVANTAKEASALEDQTAARRKVEDAVAAGLIPRGQEDRAIKDAIALQRAEIAATSDNIQIRVAAIASIERLKAAQAAANLGADTGLADNDNETNQDRLKRLQFERTQVGQPKRQQDSALAGFDESARLTKEGGPALVSSPKGQTAIQSAKDVGTAQADLDGQRALKEMTDQIAKETLALQKQQATMGMTLEQADKYNTEQKLLLEATRDGVTLDDEKRASLDKLATGYATAAENARKLTQAQQGAAEAAKTVADDMEGGLEAVIFDGKKASDAARDIAKSLGKDAFKATLTGEGPLAGLLGTNQTNTVGGSNGGILSQLTGSLFGVGKGGTGQKPTGAQGDPLYVVSAGGQGGSQGGGGIMGMIQNLFGGGGGGGGGMGGAPGADTGGALSEMAGLFHTGTSYVGTPSRMVPVAPKLFASAPRLHSGLAPDEFPAILQKGERVTAKNGQSRGGGRSTVINVQATDAASFGRSQRQIQRSMDRRAGQRG